MPGYWIDITVIGDVVFEVPADTLVAVVDQSADSVVGLVISNDLEEALNAADPGAAVQALLDSAPAPELHESGEARIHVFDAGIVVSLGDEIGVAERPAFEELHSAVNEAFAATGPLPGLPPTPQAPRWYICTLNDHRHHLPAGQEGDPCPTLGCNGILQQD